MWGDRFVSESALTSRIKAARRAIGDDGQHHPHRPWSGSTCAAPAREITVNANARRLAVAGNRGVDILGYQSLEVLRRLEAAQTPPSTKSCRRARSSFTSDRIPRRST